VHQAAAHAAHAGALAPDVLLHPVVTPHLSVVGGDQFTGPTAKSFSITQVPLTQGFVVKAHFSFTMIFNNFPVEFRGTFSGKVLSWGPLLNDTKVDIEPKGGSLVGRGTIGGGKVTEHFVPLGTLADVVEDPQGNFVGLAIPYTPVGQGQGLAEYDFLFKT